MKFKILAAALVVLMIGWGLWWRVSASAHEAAIGTWLDARRAQGWQADAAIDVNGFPNRLDLALTEPAVADPASGWSWTAPRLSVSQVIYDPTFYVVEWPPEQSLAAPGARARLRSEVMEASVRVASVAAFDLERASFDLRYGALEAEAGWTASAERIAAHVRAAPDAGPDNAYEFRVDGTKVRPPDFVRRLLDPAGVLPPALSGAAIEGRAAFDRPLDRRAVEARKPRLVALSLKEARAEWGGLALSVSGSARVDAEGYAEGEFDVSAANWEAMLDGAVAAGAVPARLAEALKSGLGFVARLTGDQSRLDVALTMRGGYTRIGPVPIGPAPKLR